MQAGGLITHVNTIGERIKWAREQRGTDANAEQVRAGMAWAFTKYLTDPAIKQAEEAARAALVGLWSEPDPMPPWEWRQKPKQ